ncbi:MAG: TetR/AcrR family transcriptional regulator [Adhaeribacter sp.]
MGIAERKLRHKEEVRCSILRAAWSLVLAEGWQALSIRKIADAIEYSVPVIYSHFESKEAILQEFLGEGFRLLNQELQTALQSSSQPARQLEALAQAYWAFAFHHKEYYQLMYGLGMPTCETVRQVPELGRFSEVLQTPLRQMLTQSGQSDANLLLKFHTFWSMLHGLVSINMVNRTACPHELHQGVLQDAVRGFIKNMEA